MAVAIGRLALASLALGACAADVGVAPATWEPVEAIDGVFAPVVGAPPSPTPIRTTLRVATFNVEHGIELPRIIDDLRRAGLADVDVLLVQEIAALPGEERPRAAALAEALGMGFVYAPAYVYGDGTEGDAILSRHVLRDARVMELPAPGAYPRPIRRLALAAELDAPGGPVTVIGVHLDTRLSAAERVLQLRPAVLDAPARVIVAGDFNSNPYAWAGAIIPDLPATAIAGVDQAAALDDYARALGFAAPTAGAGATEHIAGLRFRLDAIYVRGVTPGPAWVARDVNGSDHWPVVLDVPLP